MVKTQINKIFLGNARKRKHGLIMVLPCVWNVISGEIIHPNYINRKSKKNQGHYLKRQKCQLK